MLFDMHIFISPSWNARPERCPKKPPRSDIRASNNARIGKPQTHVNGKAGEDLEAIGATDPRGSLGIFLSCCRGAWTLKSHVI